MTEKKIQNYKIYEIYSDLIPKSYIGCTKQDPKRRLIDHKKFKDCTSQCIFWFDKNPKIRILEEIDINTDKKFVDEREKYHILKNKEHIFNIKIPLRTKKEYYQTFRDDILKQRKEYRENNIEKIKLQKKKYYENKKLDSVIKMIL